MNLTNNRVNNSRSDNFNATIILAETKKSQGESALGVYFILTIFITQWLTVLWKKTYPKTYQTCTLFGLWLFPMIISFSLQYWRFVCIWSLYTGFTGLVVVLPALKKPLDISTPRNVYKFFKICYRVSNGIGVFGLVLFLIEFFGVISPESTFGMAILESSVLLLFYSIYFGLLGRDIIQELSDRMASGIGYYNPDGLPNKHLRPNVCAICGQFLHGTLEERYGETNNHVVEDTVKLLCNHQFHEFCIYGWCIVGKKDMCPYCKEKVDMRQFRTNQPWETQEQLYLNLLDSIRYTIVIQPIIILFFNYFATNK